MAWRIHEHVIRGEIDNRVKGLVRGKLWLAGLAQPVALELRGNAHPDLAGCLLTFTNPSPPVAMREAESFRLQRGMIGDLTASRRVRVFDVPIEDALAMIRRGEKPPEHMANALYLEWFSEANGRVVIESAGFVLEISAPEWRMSPAEDQERAEQAAAGFAGFIAPLTEAIERRQRGQKDSEADRDEHDYENLMKESDARLDKYMELLEKYGNSSEAEAKIAQEMGWDRELTWEEEEQQREWIEAANAAAEAEQDQEPEPDPATEGKDWIRTPGGYFAHPLQHRCAESAMKFRRACRDLGLEPFEDDDLGQFLFDFRTTGVKLAGALNGLANGRIPSEAAFTVACLKRALGHLHQSQTGLEAAAAKNGLPENLATEARRELMEIRETIVQLMDEFRGR